MRALTRRGTGQPRCIEPGLLSYDQADRWSRSLRKWSSSRHAKWLAGDFHPARGAACQQGSPSISCAAGVKKSRINAIEVYVHRLRKKLEASGVRIVTVRGLGYCLESPRRRVTGTVGSQGGGRRSGWRGDLQSCPGDACRQGGIQGRAQGRAIQLLFGEILDWMLAPLLFLWPISIIVTHNVADNIANEPYDRAMAESVRTLCAPGGAGRQGGSGRFSCPATVLFRTP